MNYEVPIGFGTRTFATKRGPVIIVPANVDFTPTEDMTPVQNVKHITIDFGLDDPVTATIELFGALATAICAEPRYVADVNGQIKELKSVEFTDGSKWEAPK